jgi:hypothetical protein
MRRVLTGGLVSYGVFVAAGFRFVGRGMRTIARTVRIARARPAAHWCKPGGDEDDQAQGSDAHSTSMQARAPFRQRRLERHRPPLSRS